MNAFHLLSRLGSTVKERALLICESAALQFERGLQWLKLRPQAAFFAAGVGVVVLLLIYSGVTAAVAAVAAWIALIRHFAQTDAERQRRITESFSKAVEQLGNDKLEVRLGGIYSLERISKESPEDYWTVMENLTAFVRERSRRNERERNSEDLERRIATRAYFQWLEAGKPDGQAENIWNMSCMLETTYGEPPAADIDAVLGVIMRRSKENQEREKANNWRFNFRGAVLRRTTQLYGAHLEGAYFSDAHLEWALLERAHLQGASFVRAHLENTYLMNADLEGAVWWFAHPERAKLDGASGFEFRSNPSDAVNVLKRLGYKKIERW
jgi:hypothetical protein